MQPEVEERYQQLKQLAEQINQQFKQQIEKLGFSSGEVTLQTPEQASYRLETDPSNGEPALVGDWLDARGYKKGSLIFHSDGSFYAEQDIALAHPKRSGWFIEALNAWGRDQDIKAEAKLLPMPE